MAVLVAGVWTPPDGAGNFDDIFGTLDAHLGASSPPKSWADLDGEVPNGSINIADVFFAVQGGFQGLAYPFSAPQSCP